MIHQRTSKAIAVLSVTLMLALSSSYSAANTNTIPTDHLAWSQLPATVQKYYQTSSTLNKLKLSNKNIVAIRSWSDATGSNYLVQLQRFDDAATFDSPAGEVISHLYNVDQATRRVWQIYDYLPCDLDVIARYAKETAVVTDINNNGVAEVSVPYYIGCRGDVSYDEMKIIMYEGKQKFAIRGNSAICDSKTGLPVDNTGYYGGDYKIDEQLLQRAALSASQKTVFKEHLKSLWRDNQCSIYFKYDD
ncbi:M949_RS01915 family surface polysaccharide biosynthesis protein [Psychrobacter sp. AOP7-B1-24]|uniref:M949_RS01915 family surface polysaccharide biosynthesis protein n=1 Tax=Psychrobacter sp. AOP7-B1-24 TaxID=3457645 RepID=UPI00402B0972